MARIPKGLNLLGQLGFWFKWNHCRLFLGWQWRKGTTDGLVEKTSSSPLPRGSREPFPFPTENKVFLQPSSPHLHCQRSLWPESGPLATGPLASAGQTGALIFLLNYYVLQRWPLAAVWSFYARIAPEAQASHNVSPLNCFREAFPLLILSSCVAGGEQAGHTGPQQDIIADLCMHAVSQHICLIRVQVLLDICFWADSQT